MGCTQSIDDSTHINHKLYGLTAKKPNTTDAKQIVKILEKLDDEQLKVVKIPQGKSKDPFFTPFSPGPSRSANEEQLKRIKSNDIKLDDLLNSPNNNMKIKLERPSSLSSISSATSNALILVPSSAFNSSRSTFSGHQDRQLVMKTVSPKPKLMLESPGINSVKKSLSILQFISIDNSSRCNSPAINLSDNNNNINFSRETSPYLNSTRSSPPLNFKMKSTLSTSTNLPPIQVAIPFIETTRGNRSLRVHA